MTVCMVRGSGALLLTGRLPMTPADPAAVAVVLLVAVAVVWLVEDDGMGLEWPDQP